MPHAPRLHQDIFYLLNSGCSEFGKVDLDSGRFERIAFVPAMREGCPLPVTSRSLVCQRSGKQDLCLPLSAALEDKGVEARCALEVVDLRSGDLVLSLSSKGIVREPYDFAVLPGVARPTASGFKTGEIHRTSTIGHDEYVESN